MTLLTARDVATRWGVSDQTIYNMVRGRNSLLSASGGLCAFAFKI